MNLTWVNANTLLTDQSDYIKKLLQLFGMENCNPKAIPMQYKLTLTHNYDPRLSVEAKYHSLVGSLIYLANTSRPDINFAPNFLSRYQALAT